MGIKGIDTKIATNENLIKHKNLTIKDKMSEIKLNKIEQNKIKQEILSAENKRKLSQEREKSIIEEMKAIKARLISFVVFDSVARETYST